MTSDDELTEGEADAGGPLSYPRRTLKSRRERTEVSNDDDDRHLTWEPMQMMRELNVHDVREAAASFKANTVATDGVHPRQVAYLSDSAVAALAKIFKAVEALGDFAEQSGSPGRERRNVSLGGASLGPCLEP